MPVIAPLPTFPTATTPGAVAPQAVAAANAAAQTAAPAAAGATGFAATLAQVLGNFAPLTLATAVGTAGTTGAGTATAAGGLTNVIFELFLLNSLGLGQFNNQNTVQQLLQTQLLLGSLDTAAASDTTGLTAVATQQITTALIQQAGGGNLMTQLNNVSTQPNPMVFSAGALAVAFQLGNAAGLPA